MAQEKIRTEKENPMKKVALSAAFVAIVFTLVGPVVVLAADPTPSLNLTTLNSY